MKLKYFAIKEDNKPFRVVNSKLLKADCDRLPSGRYSLVIEKYRKSKSNAQLAWLYGQIYPIVLRGLNDAGWDEITNVDQVDAMMKDRFANREIVNINTGEVMEVPALKRNMSTTEFITFVEAIRKWASEYLNINIPDPGTNFNINFE